MKTKVTSRLFITCLLAGAASFGLPFAAHAQTIASWTFTTPDYQQSSSYAASSTAANVAAGTALTVTGFAQGTSANAGGTYMDTAGNGQFYGLDIANQVTAIPQTTPNTSDYASFTVTPSAGYALNLTSLTFYAQGYNSNDQVSVEYKVGSGAITPFISATTINGGSVSDNGTRVSGNLSLSGETSAVTFYFYFDNLFSGDGSDAIDLGTTSASNGGGGSAAPSTPGVILDGTVSASVAPEPSTWSMFTGVIAFMAFLVYRRRQQASPALKI